MHPFLIKTIDLLGIPITFLSAYWLKFIRLFILPESYWSERIFMQIGVLPVIEHYYQPLINPKKHLTRSLRKDRNLAGIDLNIKEQLSILKQFRWNEELQQLPLHAKEFSLSLIHI